MASLNNEVVESINSIVEEENLEVYDLEYVKENQVQYLRLYIDSNEKSSVDLDDCVNVTNKINEYLEENDPIENEFTLEVSSPGIIRKLKTVEHYNKVIGEVINVKLYKKHDKFESKQFNATLQTVTDEYIVLDEQKIDYSDIAKAMTTFEF